MRRWVALGLVALSALLQSCSQTDGCTQSNCIYLAECGLGLADDPWFTCASRQSLQGKTRSPPEVSCEATCKRAGLGTFVACAGSYSCGISGNNRSAIQSDIEERCISRPSPFERPDATCSVDCDAAFEDCLNTCDDGSFEECLPCAVACMDTQKTCQAEACR